MSFSAKIIADSVGPNGRRITTFQVRFPRFILAQFNTHRLLSRNARSSRAVPVERLLKEVEEDPVLPISWGANCKGMQAVSELDSNREVVVLINWYDARNTALVSARALANLGVHKQIVNRILDPFCWVDVVVTATEWDHFFALRCDKHAQPEFQKIAVMMARLYRKSDPVHLKSGCWHLPYITVDELAELCDMRLDMMRRLDGEQAVADEISTYIKASVARCARVSYRTFDGLAPEIAKDLSLHDRLLSDMHASPFEHQARAERDVQLRSGNFVGWTQYRKTLPFDDNRDFDFAKLDVEYKERDFVL